MRCHCGDEDNVRPLMTPVRGGMNLLRGQLVMMGALPDVSGWIPDLASTFGSDDLRWVPRKLLRDLEKGLESADVKAEEKSLIVSMSIPIDMKVLRRETDRLEKYLSEKGTDTASVTPFPPVARADAPAGSEESSDPARAWRGTGDKQSLPAVPIPPDGAAAWEYRKKAEAPVKAPSDWKQSWGTVQPEPEKIKLTVVNVRKEAAMLFEMDKDGKMSFIQKVATGEAVDVKTVTSRRLIALFADKPAGESFEAGTSSTVWLLR
jgi:hypothetical protein